MKRYTKTLYIIFLFTIIVTCALLPCFSNHHRVENYYDNVEDSDYKIAQQMIPRPFIPTIPSIPLPQPIVIPKTYVSPTPIQILTPPLPITTESLRTVPSETTRICSICDCGALQNEINTNCSIVQNQLDQCELNLANSDVSCQNRISLLQANATDNQTKLTEQNASLQSQATDLQSRFSQCKIDNTTVLQENKILTDANTDLRVNIYGLQKQIYQCLRPSQPSCETRSSLSNNFNFTDPIMFLLTQSVECEAGETLRNWNSTRDKNDYFGINYTCCKNSGYGTPYPQQDFQGQVPPPSQSTTSSNNYPS